MSTEQPATVGKAASRAFAIAFTVTTVTLLLVVGVAVRLVVGVRRRLAEDRERKLHGYTRYKPTPGADIIDAEFEEVPKDHTFH